MIYDSMSIQFKSRNEEDFAEVLKDAVLQIRRELAQEYNVLSGENANYTGLCIIAVTKLRSLIDKINQKHNMNMVFHSIHGEQAHTYHLRSSLWCYQHSWAKITFNGMTMYVDPTSSQFQKFYSDIPKFYISTLPPRWYYADIDNPIYGNKFFKFINNHITLHINEREYDGTINSYNIGLIEYFQYNIWGKYCDSKERFDRKLISK